MRAVSVIVMAISLICFGFTQLWAESEAEKAAVSAAQAWLSFIDGGNYLESWNEASSYFRGALSEQSWAGSMAAFRKPLGKLVSRKMVNIQEACTLPGAPDGRYVIMSFTTEFEHKKSAGETVTFMFNKDQKWRAAGYFVK